jgi:hypothetical protein
MTVMRLQLRLSCRPRCCHWRYSCQQMTRVHSLSQPQRLPQQQKKR